MNVFYFEKFFFCFEKKNEFFSQKIWYKLLRINSSKFKLNNFINKLIENLVLLNTKHSYIFNLKDSKAAKRTNLIIITP